ncbi:hypothetical protein BC826DRAFT_42081 [Russula brevipes]|nr:hypothetical protein BC826DRAFT_42081 [Russula brevipes]
MYCVPSPTPRGSCYVLPHPWAPREYIKRDKSHHRKLVLPAFVPMSDQAMASRPTAGEFLETENIQGPDHIQVIGILWLGRSGRYFAIHVSIPSSTGHNTPIGISIILVLIRGEFQGRYFYVNDPYWCVSIHGEPGHGCSHKAPRAAPLSPRCSGEHLSD